MRIRTAIGAWCLLVACSAQAQPVLTHVGVFSLLGDGVQVTAATDSPADTRIERTARETLEFKGIGFDLIALRAVAAVLQQEAKSAQLKMYRAPAELSVAQQREIADGAEAGALPSWMVGAVQAQKLSHVLLLTRSRGEPDIRTADGKGIGRGVVDGVGFYLDTLYQMRNITTGAVSTGLIAPYVHVRLTLMDTDTARVVARYEVRDAYAVASPEVQIAADPWSFMSAKDKVLNLRRMVEQGMTRGTQQLLKAR